MSDEKHYQAVVDAAKRLLIAERDRSKKSARLSSMRLDTHTVKSRASATDNLTGACFSVDKAKDVLHKTLVDAFLVAPKERSSYETVMLTHSHGFGHSYTFKYTPPLPRCYEV